MLKKLLIAALWSPLLALAQSYPSPILKNVTVQGTLAVTGAPTFTIPIPVASGGTNAATASGTALDNITGFASTGFLTRTGAGAYAFQSLTNGITVGNLAQAAANTVLANATGLTANVTAFAMPSCSTTTSALQYTSGIGFVCNSGMAPLASPAFTGTPSSSGDLQLNYTAPAQRALKWFAGANERWQVFTDGTTESGSNAGSNFAIARYTDAGVYVDNAFQINRATGAISAPDGITNTAISGSTGSFTTLAASTSATAPTLAFGANTTGVATTAFVAAHNTPCYSITDNGGDNTGTNDSAAAWTTTLALGFGNNRCIYLPPGRFKFNSSLSYTIPAGVGSITILGAGPDTTILAFPTTAGITINYAGTTSSAHVQNLAITTGTTNLSSALNLNQAASVTNTSNSARSDVTNVTFRGDDGYQQIDYWGTAVNVSVSNVNFDSDHFIGPNGNGNQVVLAGTSTQVPVIFNFTDDYFEGGNAQLTYGNYVQGVQVVNSNFTAGNYGIISNASELGLDQLTVTGSQFESNTSDILTTTAIPNTVLTGNLFYVQNSQTGVNLAGTDMFSITGNMFPPVGVGTSAIGINIGATTGRGGSIVGNVLNRMGTAAIQINNGTSAVTTNDNIFNSNGTNISNGSSSNLTLDQTPVTASFAAVTLTNATAANVGSVSLSPGTWFCNATTQYTSSANNMTVINTGISTTSAGMPASAIYYGMSSVGLAGGTTVPSWARIIASSNPTPVYLVALSAFASGTSTAAGTIACEPSR